ncbi:MAG: hypothetical protein AB7F35_28150 [Acetobacteraceae bacterium]
MSEPLGSRLESAMGSIAAHASGPRTNQGLTVPEGEVVQLGREQTLTKYWAEVREAMHRAAVQANQHFLGMPECCEFYDISACYTGPMRGGGGSQCNPIGYQFRIDGRQVGEPLLVELTHEDLVTATMGEPCPPYPEAPCAKLDFGWSPVPLHGFDDEAAADMLARYVSNLAKRWPLPHA